MNIDDWRNMTPAEKKDALEQMTPGERDAFLSGKPLPTRAATPSPMIASITPEKRPQPQHNTYSSPGAARAFYTIAALMVAACILLILVALMEKEPVYWGTALSAFIAAIVWYGMGAGLDYLARVVHHLNIMGDDLQSRHDAVVDYLAKIERNTRSN